MNEGKNTKSLIRKGHKNIDERGEGYKITDSNEGAHFLEFNTGKERVIRF